METWKRTANMQVVSLQEGAFVGRLDDFQFDLETWRIYGWRLKGSGMFARAGGTAAEKLMLLGRDVAFLQSEGDVEWSGGKPNHADGRAWASAYIGMAVMSRRGSSMGAIQDFVLDVSGDNVTGLLLHGGKLLVLDEEVQTGPDVVIAKSTEQLITMPDEPQRASWWRRIRDALSRREEEVPQLEVGEE
ncbi:MAG: hypothetical protein ACI8RZ_002524 [Myxococcota bacterium]|jgi:uncharacterized protein YrrD